MLRRLLMALLFSPLAFMPIATTLIAATPSDVSDQDIADAYLYLLGRLLVLRQENIDFRDEGFKWNEIIYRTPGGVTWANPNLDVTYSEAWIAVDENTPVILEVPKIEGGRYYSWQMLNGWGETRSERLKPANPGRCSAGRTTKPQEPRVGACRTGFRSRRGHSSTKAVQADADRNTRNCAAHRQARFSQRQAAGS